MICAMSIAFPGAATRLSRLTQATGATRWTNALTVVSTTLGRSPPRDRARRESVAMRLATTEAFGDALS